MDKPLALSDAQLRDIEERLWKGWVIRPDWIRSMVAMAMERNAMVAEAEKARAEKAMGMAYGGGL